MFLGLGLGLNSRSGDTTPAAPTNVVAPVVSGTEVVTQTLSVTSGSWSGYPGAAYTYQWQADTAGNGTFANIGGATSATYVLAVGESGDKVRCVVTATNASGNASANSNQTGIIAAADTTPASFTFTDITSASRSTVYTSNSITVSAINLPATISITGGTYSVNGGAYTSSAGTVVVNDTVTVQGTSSASFSTAVNVALTIGGVSDTYTVTTLAADTTPDAFSFVDVTNALRSTVYTSNPITVSGINTTSAISITGGTYSVSGGTYTSSSGTVSDTDTVTVRGTSSGSYNTAVNVVLTIGGVSGTYTITTLADPDSSWTDNDFAASVAQGTV